MAGLDPNVATDLARTLLELTLSNEALHNSALPGKYISAVNHTSVLCVSILTYLDKTSNVFLNSSSSRAVSDCSSFIIDVLNLTVSSRDIKIDLSIAELLAVILNKVAVK